MNESMNKSLEDYLWKLGVTAALINILFIVAFLGITATEVEKPKTEVEISFVPMGRCIIPRPCRA